MTTTSLANPRSRSDGVALAYIAVTVVVWASSFAAIRVGLKGLTPTELAAGRYVAAAIPAGLYLLVTRSALPSKGDFVRLVVVGLLYVTAYSILLNIGELTVPAGPASFIINTMPVLTALIAVPVLHERFGKWGWLGTAISFAGVGLIAVSGGAGFSLDTGAILIFGAAICAAVSTILQKPLLGRFPPLVVTAWVLLIGAVPLVPAVPATMAALGTASSDVVASLVYLAAVPTAIGYVTWAQALKRLPAGRAANYMYCLPPTATVIGYVWLGEVPTQLGIVGAALAIGGVVLVNVMRGR